MKNVVDLKKLRSEIDSRKKEKIDESGIIGGKKPKDSLLYGLVSSLSTGQENTSIKIIKEIDNAAALKMGEKPKMKINENVVDVEPPKTKTIDTSSSQERDELMWREFEQRKKQTLTESMAAYINPNQHGNNINPTSHHTPQLVNEGYVVENVKKIVDGYLVENFSIIVDEAIRSAVIEMFAIEKIKTALNENRELIKGVVYEVIKEIQVKAKAKQQ